MVRWRAGRREPPDFASRRRNPVAHAIRLAGRGHISRQGKTLTMIDQKDFVPKNISSHWLKGVIADTFDSAVQAASDWIAAENIDVINIETVILPIVSDKDSEVSAIYGAPMLSRQFIRVWYRK